MHAWDTQRTNCVNFFTLASQAACFARARLLLSFCSECTYSRTILGGVNAMVANAWLQYGMTVPGASSMNTERTKALRSGWTSIGRSLQEQLDALNLARGASK